MVDDHFFDYLFVRRRPVYDGSQVNYFLTSDQTPAFIAPYLTTDDGKLLQSDNPTVVGNLVRWI